MGIVLELQARGHHVVALSGPPVAATVDPFGIELRTDEMPPPWPYALSSCPAEGYAAARWVE